MRQMQELSKIVKQALDAESKVHKVKLTHIQETPINEALINTQELNITLEVVLGKKVLSIKELSQVSLGSILALNENEEEKIALYANGKKVGSGEIVAIDGQYGIKVTSLD